MRVQSFDLTIPQGQLKSNALGALQLAGATAIALYRHSHPDSGLATAQISAVDGAVATDAEYFAAAGLVPIAITSGTNAQAFPSTAMMGLRISRTSVVEFDITYKVVVQYA